MREGRRGEVDLELADLVAETATRQAALEARFPEAFRSVDAAVEQRNTKRKALNEEIDIDVRMSSYDYEYASTIANTHGNI